MALHHSLRDLVSVRGAGVVDEAEEFRGVLDDFLAEDEATLGELNLLVDAVRLGALRRVLDVIAHGAAPEAAIREAGAALARDRGTDDPTRSCWALASLRFALGKVDESMVRAFLGDTGTSGTQFVPDRSTSSSAPSPPRPGPLFIATPFDGPAAPVIREERSSRTGVYMLVVLAGLLGGLVAAGIVLLPLDNSGDAGGDDANTPDGETSDGSDLPADIRRRDARSLRGRRHLGGLRRLRYRRRLPAGTHPRTPRHAADALAGWPDDDDLAGRPLLTLDRFDLKTGAHEPFFEEAGPCDHALRPGWSLDGNQVALVCTENDEDPDGIWLSDADGNLRVRADRRRQAPAGRADVGVCHRVHLWPPGQRVQVGTVYVRQVNIVDRVRSRIKVGLEGLQLTHPDYSKETGKVLFLVSPPDDPDAGDRPPGGARDRRRLDHGPRRIQQGPARRRQLQPPGMVSRREGHRRDDLFQAADRGRPGGGRARLHPSRRSRTIPSVVKDPPPGYVGPPVWATR